MSEVINPQYKYDEEKAIAVASKLLVLSGKKCDKYWLNKIMYYIERQSLIEGGKPLFFDKLYSIPFGPILSSINDGIDLSAYPVNSQWTKHFSLNGKTVDLKKEADYAVLSPFEISIIEKTHKKFNGWDFNKLHKFFKNLPEYRKTDSREEIKYEDILSNEGFDRKTIAEIINEISYFELLENSLHCAE